MVCGCSCYWVFCGCGYDGCIEEECLGIGKDRKNERKRKIMVKENIVIENETGLHARPATEISKIAMKYKCDINFLVNGKKVNAKSPLMIMAAGIKTKTELEILCDGEDEEQALEELKVAFENQFGE